MARAVSERTFDLLIETEGQLTAGSLGKFLQRLEPVVKRGAGARGSGFRLELTALEQGSVKITLLVLGGIASTVAILDYVGLELTPRASEVTPLSKSAASMILEDRARVVTISGAGMTVIFDENDAEEVRRTQDTPKQALLPEGEPIRHLVSPQSGLVRYIDGEYFIRLKEGKGPLLPIIDRRDHPEDLKDRVHYVVHGSVARDRAGEPQDFEITYAMALD